MTAGPAERRSVLVVGALGGREKTVSDVPGSPDRREVIRDAAAELFASKGVAATTVREIADAVGILSGSLYHHFRSKQHIVEEILTNYFEDLQKSYAAV